jgi:hypothetical protein
MRQDPSVWIEGRPYRMGADYLPDPGHRRSDGEPFARRRLLGYDPTFPWDGGRVTVCVVQSTVYGERARRHDMSGRAWVEWARVEWAREAAP